ncbi:Putative 4-hydroxy-4-methyl-2-oxoglutarate aldolase 3, partial [Linum grandiflorum]
LSFDNLPTLFFITGYICDATYSIWPGERTQTIIIPLPKVRIDMAGLALADICDSNIDLLANGDVRVLKPIFQIYGQRRRFSGQIVTLKLSVDNVLVRQTLESAAAGGGGGGGGKVLVIDGGGAMKCALLGGRLSECAQKMGWAGVVVYGCIRDVDEINACDIGVRALASHPVKPGKRNIGEKHVAVEIAGTTVRDGEWLYADNDGILVSKSELSA